MDETKDQEIRKKEEKEYGKEEKSRILDDFWNISDLLPQKRQSFGYARSTDAVDIFADDSNKTKKKKNAESSSTVIKRYIPPNSDGKLTSASSFSSESTYTVEHSLIHRVKLKKWSCRYHYYHEFYSDALRYMNVRGEACEYKSFFSYVPQYNQLDPEQLSYYFWFRENAKQEIFIKTDYSYVLLYIYELINLGAVLDVRVSQRLLTSLWNEYHDSYPALKGKLADWICDFSLIHKLSPPENAGSKMVAAVQAMKEFYIAMPDDNMGKCTSSLMKYCSSYDYRTSKFATKENLPLFEKHVFEAMLRAVLYYSSDGNILSGISFRDSMLVRDAYAGALCVAKEKYRLEVEYCSFSRSGELRFLVGDIVKYAENKLRQHLGIKSRITVYSLPTELKNILDEYFTVALPRRAASKPRIEKKEYDVLYDAPVKPLSLTDAAKIEAESWSTTKELVEAFEETAFTEDLTEVKSNFDGKVAENDKNHSMASLPVMKHEAEESNETNDLRSALGIYLETVIRILSGDSEALLQRAKELGKMPDALADEINEIGFEIIGDALLEESDEGEGTYHLIEDYRELFESIPRSIDDSIDD